MDTIFARHTNVALAFSGGRDSLACLHLLRPYWGRLTVYWLNPGNPFPETVALMADVRRMVPRFKEIPGRQPEIIARDGWPSDVVPQRYTSDGNTVFGPTPFKVQTRLQCCIRSLMMPAYTAMLADDVTCCIRGKREEEADKTGIQSGYVSEHGMELIFPIYDWTAADVSAYLKAQGVSEPESYRYAKHSLDCMDCTAWWGEGLPQYLHAQHPAAFTEYVRRIGLIKRAVADQLSECEV
jgi:phosphoadenosine phosphosulfate reductase